MLSARTNALAWLEARQSGVPDSLRTVVFDAVIAVGDGPGTPEAVLRSAADLLLSKTVTPEKPTDPVILLAADALITYVCEHRSELAPELLDALL